MTAIRLATCAALVILLLATGVPSGLGQAPPQGAAKTCAGAGGLIAFEPPLANALSAGVVSATIPGTCCGPMPGCGESDLGFDGTYAGDCNQALIKSEPGEINLWGGRVLQATGVLALLPNSLAVVNFISLLDPEGACEQESAAIVATTLTVVFACRPEPGSDACGL